MTEKLWYKRWRLFLVQLFNESALVQLRDKARIHELFRLVLPHTGPRGRHVFVAYLHQTLRVRSWAMRIGGVQGFSAQPTPVRRTCSQFVSTREKKYAKRVAYTHRPMPAASLL